MGLILNLKPVAACTCDATSAVSDQRTLRISPGGGHFHIDGDVAAGGGGGGGGGGVKT